MTLTNHTTSLELAIALKEAGWPQGNSLFQWIILSSPSASANEPTLVYQDVVLDELPVDQVYAAPIASELMERIGNAFNEWSMGYDDSGCYYRFFYGGRGAGGMVEGCGGSFSVLDLGGENEPENTPTNALAKLALHLIQEGIIKF